MNILQVIPYFTPKRGGDVNICYNLSRRLAKKGHKVAIITTDFEFDKVYAKSIEEQGVEIKKFKCVININLLLISPSMKKWLKNNIQRFDVIHMHDYRSYQNNVVHDYAKRFGVPYVLQAHGSLSRLTEKRRVKWLYDVFLGSGLLKDASKFIALNEVENKQFKHIGVPEDKIAIIPNGIDLLEYQDLPPKGTFKKEYAISEDEKIVLYLGRMHKLKGIDFLIRSFARLRSDVPNAKLILAGGDDGYLTAAKRLGETLKCIEHTMFIGPISDGAKISAFVDSEVTVYPERTNVFGLVPLEAAACEKPVIVSNENYLDKIVKEGGFGFSVDYGDIEGLTKLLRSLLVNKTLAAEMGAQGRQFVADNFSIEQTVNKVEELYQTVRIT